MQSVRHAHPRRSRMRGALLGTMVGDALGLPFEGEPTAFAELAAARAPTPDAAEPEQARQALAAHLAATDRLTYSDDTQLMIALAEAMIDRGVVEADAVAARFADDFDPARGYGAGALQVLRRIAGGEHWSQASRSVYVEGSFGNGAAMRVAPVGALYHDRPGALQQAAERSAVVTHVHPDGIAGAVVQAQAIGVAMTAGILGAPLRLDYFARALVARIMAYGSGSSLLEPVYLAYELARRGESVAAVRQQIGNGIMAAEAVPAALWAFLAGGGEMECTLGLALMVGGDSDTIGAMAGALAGAFGGEETLPVAALEALAGETVGVEAVRACADRLLELRREDAGPVLG